MSGIRHCVGLAAHFISGLTCCLTRRALPQITRRLYDHVWESWHADTGVLVDELPAALRAGGPAPQKLGQTLERWLLLLKVWSWHLLRGTD
jgi:hypothetical protein